jgi:hypothetical protein
MKKILLSILTLAVLVNFYTCKDNAVTNQTGPSTLSGKIENWYYGSDKKVVSYLISLDTIYNSWDADTAQISASGEFKLDFAVPTNEQLNTVQLFNTSCTHNSTINPASTKWVGMNFRVLKNDSLFGYMSKSSDTLSIHPGTIQSSYYYFDVAGSMMGTDTCGINYGLENVTNLNINFNHGWNELYIIYNALDSMGSNITVTSQQKSVKWYFTGSMYPEKKVNGWKRN